MTNELIDRAVAFTRDHVAPHAQSWERDRVVPIETFRAAGAEGFCRLLVPREHGGLGLPFMEAMGVFEEISTACMAFAFSLTVQNNTALGVANAGSANQVARYLPGLISGETVASFLLTEPGTGSDAAAITTTATRDGDGWVIDGEKAWITNGAIANLLNVFAQTDVSQGWRGIATFLVEADNPGVERLPAYELMAGHAMGTGGFKFTGCRVDGDALYRGPGVGFKEAMRGINVARAGVGAMCCGMLRSGLDTALAYAAERQAFGQATIEFQGLQWMLADVATDLEASRLLTRAAAQAIDEGDGAVAASHAKKFATRVTLKGLADCMQVMGAAGFKAGYPLGRHLACAKMAQYLDGTTEIQNLVIARDLMRDFN